MMARVANGRSNIYNASARAKARKATLIDSTRMRQLIQQGTDSIGVSIGELGYRSEMDLYASRMDGCLLYTSPSTRDATLAGIASGG